MHPVLGWLVLCLATFSGHMYLLARDRIIDAMVECAQQQEYSDPNFSGWLVLDIIEATFVISWSDFHKNWPYAADTLLYYTSWVHPLPGRLSCVEELSRKLNK